MNFRTTCFGAAAAAVGCLIVAPATSFAATAVVKQVKVTPEKPVDLGVAPASEVKHLTLALKLLDRAKLEAYIASTTDRSSANFRRFLTPQQFKASYGQSDAAIARIRSYLATQGIAVTKVYENNLLIGISATNAQIASVFGSPVHTYQLKASTYQKPIGATAVPAEISDVVGGVAGLSTQALFKPHRTTVPKAGKAAAEANVTPLRIPTPKAAATGIPGQYTVADLANQYNINPLYARGITGQGVTLGILTFAGFDPADAYAYWSAIGLPVDPNRITRVPVDGGSGDGDGADETTLDVEQSGGVAPGAKIRVYEAPNTDVGAIDLYFTAVNENLADTLSVSWGLPEIAQDPGELPIYDAILLQAAAQGMPLSASSGDSGAYDINNYYPYPTCTATLTVDFPSSHPYVFAAGGTTLPGTIQRRYGTVNVPVERPWAWSIFRDYLVKYYGQATYYASSFPVGGGGGVGLYYDVPSYQAGLTGVKLSQTAQSLYCSDASGAVDYIDLPRNYAGRNVPDVSLNADPYTGYLVYYQGEFIQGFGGTSFVAPQLNGIFALISQQLGGRVGFPHPQFYGAFKSQGYGSGSPFRPVVSGDDLFYSASSNFNPATGLGVLDVNNLANTLSAK